MTVLSYTVPVAGSTSNAVADPQVASALTTILSWAGGNIDATSLAALLAQSAGVNQSGQTVKGAVNIPASQSTSSTTFTTLSTPDQVTGLALPANGLIAVWYQATWQESVSGAARATIFLGANEVQAAAQNGVTTTIGETQIGGTANKNVPLSTIGGGGLISPIGGTGYTGDVTTGQFITEGGAGGPTYIFAAAGTYTVSVQFKASSGSVTASNRKLWAQVLSFT